MARPLRLQFPRAVYHLTARGNARQDIYLDDMDRLAFVRRLGHEVQQQRGACYACCLMSNHDHLLGETPERNLVSGMQRLNGMYCQWLTGGMAVSATCYKGAIRASWWTVIFIARAVPLRCAQPVRARMVKAVGAWPWSS